jgi:hypothetical protein
MVKRFDVPSGTGRDWNRPTTINVVAQCYVYGKSGLGMGKWACKKSGVM